MISQRTTAALAAAKMRGVRLGNPQPDLAKASSAASAKAARFRETVAPLIARTASGWFHLRAIAAELNERGMKTTHGRRWQAASVLGVLNGAPSRS
jgi:DNA invertase Pin-like site-specific DNA recombinase